jgi:hypothetical protein
MKLADYYRAGNARVALDRYTEEYARSWPVSEKVRLDAQARRAFDPGRTAEERRDGFREIYEGLRRRWQVFRGGGTHWRVDRIHDALSEQVALFGPASDWTLSNLKDQPDSTPLLRCIEALIGLRTKQNGNGSVMATSKFLHFMNPALFPIYDTSVVENRVLHTFRRDWSPFVPHFRATIIQFDLGVFYYLRYMLFGAEMIRPHRDAVMKVFGDWFSEQLAREGTSVPPAGAGPAPEARAFEFIAVGAAACESRAGA